MKHAILDDEYNVIPCTLQEFIAQSKSISTQVARYETDGYMVSTVFLGMSHSGYWFETMVFDSRDEEIQLRAKTYQDALELHYETVGRMHESPNAPFDCGCSSRQLQFLGERKCNFEQLDKVDQFTFVMLA